MNDSSLLFTIFHLNCRYTISQGSAEEADSDDPGDIMRVTLRKYAPMKLKVKSGIFPLVSSLINRWIICGGNADYLLPMNLEKKSVTITTLHGNVELINVGSSYHEIRAQCRIMWFQQKKIPTLL